MNELRLDDVMKRIDVYGRVAFGAQCAAAMAMIGGPVLFIAAFIVPAPLQPLCVYLGSQVFVAPRCTRDIRQPLIRDFCKIPRHAWLDRLQMLLDLDLRPRQKDLRAPVTILWGEKDRVVFAREEAEIFRAAGHGGAIRMIPGVGHGLWAEAPAAVAEEVRRQFNGRGPT